MTLKEFIIEYLNKPDCVGVSAVDSEFHDAVAKQFPELRRKYKNWGAQPVPLAMTTLKQLYKECHVLRGRISLGANWQPGFPKWVYSYYIPNENKWR